MDFCNALFFWYSSLQGLNCYEKRDLVIIFEFSCINLHEISQKHLREMYSDVKMLLPNQGTKKYNYGSIIIYLNWDFCNHASSVIIRKRGLFTISSYDFLTVFSAVWHQFLCGVWITFKYRALINVRIPTAKNDILRIPSDNWSVRFVCKSSKTFIAHNQNIFIQYDVEKECIWISE